MRGLILARSWLVASRISLPPSVFGMAVTRIGMLTRIGGGNFMAGSKQPERQILVTLPEDKMMRLVKRAAEAGQKAHEYAQCKLLEAIK